MNTILVWTRYQDKYVERLTKMNFPEAEFLFPGDEADLERLLPEANIILANPTKIGDKLGAAKNLQWLQSVFAGVDALFSVGADGQPLRSDYLLTNVRETYGEIMGEYVLAYILMFEKEVLENLAVQKEKRWAQKPYASVKEKVVGVMGTGSIGKEIARCLKYLGMRVLGYRHSEGKVEGFDQTYHGEGLEEFLGQCDYVVSVLPRTEATNDLICVETLAKFKEGAVLINVGRGNAVDEGALVEALASGHLRAAVLDVFKEEPLPESSALWSVPNLYITPHVSGCTMSDRIFEIFEDNYRRFLAGEDLQYLVDFEKGY
jgi:phosphoglycerate dehydrogenase-like enzyme